MAVDVSRFVTPEQSFDGLSQLTDNMEKRAYRDEQLAYQREGKRAATAKGVTDYLNPKDFLTGTNYDPEIVKQLNEALQEGMALASKGADTPTIMMALGAKVNRISEYSTKAKLLDGGIKSSLARLKPYKGFNVDAIEQEAKKSAFYDEDGKLKDISKVDPSEDHVTRVLELFPERVTTAAGLDDFVAKTPMQEASKELQTMYMGRKRNVKYDAKTPFWMDVATDEKGETALDKNGNPIGLDVVGSVLKDDNGAPIVNPETSQPYKVMDKARFDAIVKHNPDINHFLRGQVRAHFQEIGAEKMPAEGSPQWEMMARAIMFDELKTRDKSYFKTRDLETKTAPATRIEFGLSPYPVKTSSGKKGEGSIDLTDYPDAPGGGKNITELMQGVKVTGLPDGKTLLAESVVYNPKNQTITFKEYTNRNDKGVFGSVKVPKTVSLTKFLQDIKTNNPSLDMKFLEGLRTATIDGKKSTNKPAGELD